MLIAHMGLWGLIGILVGGCAIAARLGPSEWQGINRYRLLLIGIIVAITTGWLGVWLLGKYFATALALWVSIVAVILGPPLWLRVRRAISQTPSQHVHLKNTDPQQ